MEITHSKISLSLLRGMLDCITPNMRCISVEYGEEFIYLFFYYQDKPSQEEEELAEEVATSVVADFPDIAVMDFEVNKIILPYPFKPDKGNLIVYHRYEPTLRETTS